MNHKKQEQKRRRQEAQRNPPFSLSSYLYERFGDHRTEDEKIVDEVMEKPQWDDFLTRESPLMAKLRK